MFKSKLIFSLVLFVSVIFLVSSASAASKPYMVGTKGLLDCNYPTHPVMVDVHGARTVWIDGIKARKGISFSNATRWFIHNPRTYKKASNNRKIKIVMSGKGGTTRKAYYFMCHPAS